MNSFSSVFLKSNPALVLKHFNYTVVSHYSSNTTNIESYLKAQNELVLHKKIYPTLVLD